MRKTRRQVLAVMLAAVMAFTSPGTASYAAAENGTAAEDSLQGGNVASPEEDGSRASEAGTETDGSIAGEPGTDESTAGGPGVDEGTAGEPGTDEGTAGEAGAGESKADGSAAEESTAGEPGTDEGTASEPGTDEGTASEAGAGESKADGSAAEESTAGEPGTGESTTGEPGTGESAADGPGTDESTAGEPGVGEGTAGEPGTGESIAGEPGTADADSEGAGLCAHHQEHTEGCGYKPAAGDEEGSPCAFVCRICRMEKLLLALPEEVSEDNADEVRTQLEEILALYTELTEEEQEQADISRCLELQAALDILGGQNHAGKPALIAEAVSYQDCNINGQNWETKTCTDYTAVTSETPVADWSDGWYVVNGEVTIESRIKVSGTVHLILMDDCVLNAGKGVSVNEGNSLMIYAQSDGDNMGQLKTTGSSCAGIGGDNGKTSGTVTINGGSITAIGDSFGAGIGGGDGGSGGTITINGGTVSATGSYAAGIGGGYRGSGGAITINGGTVSATGGSYGAGIGGGSNGSGGTITINGGTVSATGGSFAAGIGGGYGGSGGTIAINGGTVSATGGKLGAGIGGGYLGSGGNVVIIGGTVNGTTYHAVTFNVHGMVGVQIPVQVVVEGKTATAPDEIEGYLIEGWYTDEEYKTKFVFDTPIDSDIILYAKWEENTDYIADVTIDSNTVPYTTISGAWRAVQGRTAALKLLKDLSLTANLEITDGATNVTIEAAEGAVIRSTTDFFIVRRGKLTLKSGIFESSGYGKSGIFMTDGNVEMTGGSIKMTGSGATKGIEIRGSGTLCISGGTLETTSKDGAALLVSELTSGGTVSLTGGTLINENSQGKAVKINNEKIKDGKITDLLGDGYAFYEGGTLFTDAVTKDSLGTGTYSVEECTHNDVLQQGNQDKHFKRCSACGRETEFESHAFDEGNTCKVCGAKRVALVEIDGMEAVDYVSLEGAWTALEGKKGTITLLQDVTTTNILTVSSGMDVTFKMADGVTFENTTNNCFEVIGGSLTLASGKVAEKGLGKSIVYAASGTLCMTGGTYESNANGLYVESGVTVRLSGGTVKAFGTAFRYGSRKVMDMLDQSQEGKHFAFYDSSDSSDGSDKLIVEGLDGEKLASGTYTVRDCTHAYEMQQGSQDMHYEFCPACGDQKNEAPHTYKDGICEGCKAEIQASVTVGEQTSYYPTLASAWAAVQGKTATLTILKDNLSLTTCMEMNNAATDLTVKAEAGVEVNSTSDFFIVNAGKLALESGNYESSGDGKSGIYMTDGTVEMSGGSIKMTGSGNTKGIQIKGSGTLHISGGTLEVSGNSSGHALLVTKGTVQLTGGVLKNDTGKALKVEESGKTIRNLLEAGYCVYGSDGNPVTDDVDGKELASGTYTVNECTHHAYETQYDQKTHFQRCTICGMETEHIPHSYGEGGACTECGMTCVASVDIGGEITGYGSFVAAWSSLAGKVGTIKLWQNVETTKTFTVSSGMDVTLEMAEGVTFKNTANDCFQVKGGTLTLSGGTVVEEKSGLSIVYAASGCLNVTGGTYQSSGNGLWVDSGAEVHLSGGTLIIPNGTALRYQSPRMVREMLKQAQGDRHFALYDIDGSLVTEGMEGGVLPSGTYTVGEGRHDYVQKYDEDAHYQFCPVCGSEKDRAPHTFGADGFCTVCGAGNIIRVETDGETADYILLEEAWAAVQGKAATLTFLKNLSLEKSMTITDSGTDLTVKAAEGVTVSSTSDFFIVKNGKLSISSGVYESRGNGKSGIYMTGGSVEMTGGSIKMTGAGETKAIHIDGGSLAISGGTLEVSGNEAGVALLVSYGTVSLSGGTLIGDKGRAVDTESSWRNIKHLLAEGYAIYDSSNKLLAEELFDGDTLESGPYTVNLCSHNYVSGEDGEYHYSYCSICGMEGKHEPHTFQDGYCTACGYPCAASVEIEGVSADYGTLEAAWAALKGKKGTITLRRPAWTDQTLVVDADMDVTVEMVEEVYDEEADVWNEGGLLYSLARECFRVNGGTLTLASGEVVSYTEESEAGENWIVNVISGVFRVTGGRYVSDGGNGFYADSGASVQLSGGTFIIYGYGEKSVALEYGAPHVVREMLAPAQEGKCFVLYCRYSESEEGEESGEGIVPDSLLGQESLKAGVYSVMPVTVALDSTEELVYDGSAKTPGAKVSMWDGYSGESIELTAGTDYEVSYSNNVNAGSDAVITIAGKSFNGNLTHKFTIEKAEPDIGMVTADIPANTLDVSQVVLNRENGSIAGTLKLADGTALKYGSNLRSWKFTPEDTEPQNYKEITGEVEIIAADTIAPTASYRIDTDGWKKFIHTVSFGLFCKDYKKVTISGTDDTDEVTGSGIAEIQYFISDKWIPDEEIVKTGDLEWSNYNYNEEEEISLDGTGTYFIYVKVSDQAGNKAVYNSEGIVIYRESGLSPSDLTYTYRQEQDCTVQLAMNGNTFKALTDTDGNVISADCYTIDSNGALTLKGTYLDTLSQGTYAYQVIMNPQGVETDNAALEYAFTVRKKPAELTVTGAAAAGRPYDGTNTVEITAVTLSGIAPGDDVSVSLKGVRGELSGVNAGTYASVTLPELALTGEARSNYTLVQPKEAVPASVVIDKAEAGSAAENTLHRSYLYSRENTDRISLTGLLPRDCGTVSCSGPVISGNVAYSSEPAVNDGTLSYTLKNGNAGDEGTITVTLTTQNYEDITITVIVKLSSLIPVRLKEGTEVTLERDTLVYGEAFSELVFQEAEFVDIDGNTVEGTLAWKDAALKPGVGTISNIWIFTPSDTAYASAEGMMMITVKKAVPVVSAVPSVADRVYNPSRALADSDLSGGQAAGVDGNALEGTWSWEKADIVPTVDNHGYMAIFTPADANLANYETAAAAVPVTVAKAVPYIAKLPSAGGITYGDTLGASSLSGGIAQYGNGAGLAGDGSGSTERVEGTFMWKDTALKPVAADSGVTGYRITFTPSDTVNYETAECEVSLEVKKADSAPNMPDSAMKVTNSCEKVSSVALPEGWEWQEADREKALEIGKAVNAVAVYTGADSGNYEKETVTVAITRAVCSHANTEIRNAKEAACQETGYTGDTWCLDCGIKLETGTAIPALGHDYTSEVTKEPTEDSEGIRTYTCTRCGDSYTESIDKLDPSHPGSTSEPGTTTNPGSTPEPGTTANPGSTPKPGTTANPSNTPEPGTTANPGNTPEPGATSEPPIPSATPEPGKPFIKGADGKIGWDVIRAEEAAAEEGSTINVDMNGTAMVPGDIFDSIRGRDITVTFDMGDGIIWSVDGKKILTDRAGDIDFSVKTGTDTIPVDIVNNVTGERYSIQLSLAHNGEFGFTAVLSIQLGTENAGLTASLYYYNRSTGELEYVCADKVAEDGSASLAFTHASDYIIVIGESREEESENTEPAQPGNGQAPAGADGNADAKESPRTGQERKTEWPVVAGILTFVVAGIAILLVRRKKERGE